MIDYMALQQQYEFNVYPKRDLVLVKGKGAKVWDANGNEYIDCIAGHGVANLGHCHKSVVQAVIEQMNRFVTCSNVFYNDKKALLLEKLIQITPKNLTQAFLCNSGTEAVEGAIKFARYATQKTDFVCAMRGFHGRTMGAVSATYNPKYRDDFKPLVPGFHHVPFNHFDKLRNTLTENTAGVILEIVQGEGGVNIGEKEYFLQVAELCRKQNVLLIIDEVQSGFCRTGRMFACNHFDLEPDMLLLAKSIAGGIPMGAIVCSDRIKAPLGKHGTTFGGNPLSCAAALAAIDVMIDEKLAEQAREKGTYFMDRFLKNDLQNVRNTRHLGLMIGIELKEKSKPYILKLMEEGVLALPAGPTVIRLLPPLMISHKELEFVAEKLVKVLG